MSTFQTSIALVYAASAEGLIGRDNWMPWRLPDDLRHFKALTSGHTLLMGRKTFAAIGKALPNRKTLVLSRDRELSTQYSDQGVEVIHDLETLSTWLLQHECPKLFVAGGAEIYRLTLPFAHRIHRTLVHGGPQAQPEDTLFRFDADQHWRLESAHYHPADDQHAQAMTFLDYQRIGNTPAQPPGSL